MENNDNYLEMWKIKRLLKTLTVARGNGTSMISLVIPPKEQLSRISKMLADEYGTKKKMLIVFFFLVKLIKFSNKYKKKEQKRKC